jgi:hypothetical protein
MGAIKMNWQRLKNRLNLTNSLLVALSITTLAIVILIVLKTLEDDTQAKKTLIQLYAQQTEEFLNIGLEPVYNNIQMIEKWLTENPEMLQHNASNSERFIQILENDDAISHLMIRANGQVEIIVTRMDSSYLFFEQKDGDYFNIYKSSIGSKQQGQEKHGLASFLEKHNYDTLFIGQYFQYSLSQVPTTGARSFNVTRQFGNDREAGQITIGIVADSLQTTIRENPSYANFKIFLNSKEALIADFSVIRNTPNSDREIATKAFNTWVESGYNPTPFRFFADGKIWWGSISLLKGTSNIGFGIYIDDTTITQDNDTNFYLLLLLIAALIWLFVFIAIRRNIISLSGRISPVDADINTVLAIIRDGENDEVEFKSTLRWNIKAQRNGKEIELAALKTLVAYMNTDGGSLFIGVGDDGTILGLEADGFENEDRFLQHFANIFDQHIGSEFLDLIDYRIYHYQDKSFFMIAVKSSKQPVFLSNREDESFYIRSASSSRKLSPSQILDYVGRR